MAIEGEGGDRAGTEAGEDSGKRGGHIEFRCAAAPMVSGVPGGGDSEELEDRRDEVLRLRERSLCGGHYRGPRDGTVSSRTSW